MNLTPDNIRKLIEENKDLLTLKESFRYPGLFVLKYRKKVFYEGLWNEFLEEARGLVLDKDFNIISRPFLKIYNYGIEKEVPHFELDEPIFAYRKINGFMLAVTSYNGELLVSTTGSLDSIFVDMGKEWIESMPILIEQIHSKPDYTFLFECCDTADPHIIDETPGLYYLGARHKTTGSVEVEEIGLGDEFLFPTVRITTTLLELSDLDIKGCKHEGFVFYDSTYTRAAKIKSPYYLTKKMLMRKNMDKIMSTRAHELLDEEFYPLLNYIQKVDRENFFVLDEKAKRDYIEKWFYENQ